MWTLISCLQPKLTPPHMTGIDYSAGWNGVGWGGVGWGGWTGAGWGGVGWTIDELGWTIDELRIN